MFDQTCEAFGVFKCAVLVQLSTKCIIQCIYVSVKKRKETSIQLFLCILLVSADTKPQISVLGVKKSVSLKINYHNFYSPQINVPETTLCVLKSLESVQIILD